MKAREVPSDPPGLMIKHTLCGVDVPARQTISPYWSRGGEETDGEPVITPCWAGVTCKSCIAAKVDEALTE